MPMFFFDMEYTVRGRVEIPLPDNIKTQAEAEKFVKENWDIISMPLYTEFVEGTDRPNFDKSCIAD